MSAPDTLPAPPRRRTWVTLLMCALIFGGGAVTGAGAAVVWVGRQVLAAVQHPEDAPHRIVQRLQRKLDLDDAEAARVEAAMARRHAELLDARAQFLEQAGPILDQMEADVAAELPAAKAAGFRSQFRRLRDEWTPRLEHLRARRNH